VNAQDGQQGATQVAKDLSSGVIELDGIVGILQFAVDGLDQQQQVIAGNLANSNTPGYTAQQVDFQSSLQQALDSPDGGTAQVVTSDTDTPAGTDGNNVDTGQQLVDAEQASLQYQTMVEMLDSQFSLVKEAAGGGSS
jgi:flagellar basal-body rod protein FlgB